MNILLLSHEYPTVVGFDTHFPTTPELCQLRILYRISGRLPSRQMDFRMSRELMPWVTMWNHEMYV